MDIIPDEGISAQGMMLFLVAFVVFVIYWVRLVLRFHRDERTPQWLKQHGPLLLQVFYPLAQICRSPRESAREASIVVLSIAAMVGSFWI